MGEFIRVSHRVHCGCIYDEHDQLMTPCEGHRDHTPPQRGKHAVVVPLHKPIRHFLAALNPFHRGGIRRP